MKRVNFLSASAALLAWSLGPAQAAPRSKAASSPAGVEATLDQIDEWSAAVADASFRLSDFAQRQLDPESHQPGLDVLKDNINKIGKDLKVLEAERGSLAAWEVQALDRIAPLMKDAADNAQNAIQTFNSDRSHLWATSYVDDTAKVAQEADKVSALIRDYRRLEKTQEKEQRIERDLGDAAQF